jgi:hypothetical protein
MAATTYTGTGASLAVSNAVNGVSFQPDFVWAKVRNNTYSHNLEDSVRGVTLRLLSDSTAAEAVGANGQITAFNSNGFTQNGGVEVGASAGTYVAWQWKAGGTPAVSNTSGSITSTVSANTTSGFSIVSYTGNGASGATIGHGLGVAPKMVIAKLRNSAGFQWSVYHASLASASNYLYLNSTAAQATDATYWGAAPTSSVFTVGTNANTNNNTSPFIAYCFAEVAGYSKIGSWQNNNSTDGTFVYCGFRPRFLFFKSYDSTENWYIQDSSRQPYNYGPGTTNFLLPNATNAEQGGATAATAGIDFLSNGFKIRTTNPASGEIGFGTRNYIFLAIAENPFKYANAR